MTQQSDWIKEREAIRARWDAETVPPSPERRALQLVHNAREMFLNRIAKYNDPRNEEWDWDDITDKWERHAYSAFRDLLTAESDLRRLLARVDEVEVENAKLRQRDAQSRESGCWCDEHGHPCKGCEVKQELTLLRKAGSVLISKLRHYLQFPDPETPETLLTCGCECHSRPPIEDEKPYSCCFFTGNLDEHKRVMNHSARDAPVHKVSEPQKVECVFHLESGFNASCIECQWVNQWPNQPTRSQRAPESEPPESDLQCMAGNSCPFILPQPHLTRDHPRMPSDPPASEPGEFWQAWFGAVGEHATVEVIHATAKLVLAEREMAVRRHRDTRAVIN